MLNNSTLLEIGFGDQEAHCFFKSLQTRKPTLRAAEDEEDSARRIEKTRRKTANSQESLI